MARREGFTLIELLVVTAVMGIAVIYMFETVTAGNRAYTVLDQVAETQQSMRAVADLLERDIRHAGMMVPQGAAVCGVDNTADPDVLYVSDAEAIDPGGDIMPYEGAQITSAGVTVAGSDSGDDVTIGVASLLLEPSPPRAAYDTNADGTSDSDFRVGAGVIVMDVNDPGRGTVCGSIEAVNLGASSIRIHPVRAGPLDTASGAVKLVAVPAHEYRISNGDELRRDGLLLAKGVEDLQLAYFLDADGDNQIDSGEMSGTEAGTNDYAAQGTDMSDLREVRLNLVVRTRAEDEGFTGRPQAKENRAGGADDGFRRRAYTATIMLRNMFSRVGT
jgi:prepilin-type N-terminal cleavage/methylation domain-containing protein